MPRDDISAGLLLRAYQMGVFPMAESRDDTKVFWVDPETRGVMPLDGFHLSRSLKRTLLKTPFHASLNQDFDAVVQACANRDETWISDRIFDLYRELHEWGYAHSLEIWDGDDLVGGVYGVAIGQAFFGESMFSRRRDASKLALAWLVAHLRACGFQLFDTQFLTPHLASLGAVEVERDRYHKLLKTALAQPADILAQPLPDTYSVVQRVTHTSKRE